MTDGTDDKEEKGKRRIFNGIVKTVFPAPSSWSQFVTEAARSTWTMDRSVGGHARMLARPLEWAKLLLAEPSFVGETLSIVTVHVRRRMRMGHHNFIGNTDCRHPRGGDPSNQHANAKDLDAWRMRRRGRSPLRISPCQIPRGSWQSREALSSFLPRGLGRAAGDLMWTSNYAPITDSIITERAREGVPQGWEAQVQQVR